MDTVANPNNVVSSRFILNNPIDLTLQGKKVILCMTLIADKTLRILDFEWDEGNSLHLQLSHGIEPEEAEEVFAHRPFYRKTKKGHYAAFGPTFAGRYLTIIFEIKPKGIARPITGWDMRRAELRYYKQQRK